MKIVSINYLAAVGALGLLTPSTDAQQNLRTSYGQQRLRALNDGEDVPPAMSASMSMANINGVWSVWWGGAWVDADEPSIGAKSAKSKVSSGCGTSR